MNQVHTWHKLDKDHPVEGPKQYFGFDEPAPFKVGFTPSQHGIFNIYLFGEIESASQFVPAINAMEQATPGDVVWIHLSTNGGCTDATDTFIQAMQECQGRVIVKASGGVHSAGTIILLNAPEFTLSENFNALVHNGAMGGYSKTSDIKAQMEFQAKYMDALVHKTYEGFMTDAEIAQMIAGKDFWFGPAEWMERFSKREAYVQQKYGTGVDEE